MAAMTKLDEAKILINLIIDKVNKRVLYAEADYTFVDILFSFMTLPLGTIARRIAKYDDKNLTAFGNLNNLYKSLKDFPECYLSTEECKHMLLNPRSLSYDHCRNLKFKIDDTEPLKYFVCATHHSSNRFFSTSTKAKCRECGNLMNQRVIKQKPNICFGGSGVFVYDTTTFIVTDDLCVMPYTSANSLRLLTSLGITNKSCLEERKLDMDCEQILHLLKIALSLDYVFTYLVFNGIKPIQCLVFPGQSSTLDKTNPVEKGVSATPKMLLEVSLQKSTGKLLFAEAKEDFVEFLFGLLSIPLGTVVGGLMKGASSLTCMDNIFKSISKLSVGRCLISQDIKDMLLKPHIGQHYSSKNQVFLLEGTPFDLSTYHHIDPRINGGLLKQSGKFFVTDDLIITRSSSYSTLSTLNDLNVPFDDVEQHETSIGAIEGLKLLKASLRSCSTLTDGLERLCALVKLHSSFCHNVSMSKLGC